MGILLLLACHQGRPDETSTGAHYEPDDVLAWVDGPEGRVRAHYSDLGPNAVDQTDDDEDGVPDRAQDAAAVGELVLDWYAFVGFAPPVTEAEVGLEGAGGSDALDLYLVDLAEIGVQGMAANEACEGVHCEVFVFVQHNEASLDDIVAHELFHVIQGAYDASTGEPGWLVEGTAERASDPFGGAGVDGSLYLARPECGLAEIDGHEGCGAGAYGAALLWSFLEAEVDPDIILHTLEHGVDLDGIDALAAALADAGTSLGEQWPTFAAWNLATGPRRWTWPDEGHANAALLAGVPAAAEGASIAYTARYEPYSARYFRLDHAGGEVWVATDGPADPLTISLHPVADGAADGPVLAPLGPWGLPSNTGQLLGEFPAGGVWVTVSHPGDDARKVGLCIGSRDAVEACRAGCGTPVAPALLPILLAAGWVRRHKPGPPRRR